MYNNSTSKAKEKNILQNIKSNYRLKQIFNNLQKVKVLVLLNIIINCKRY